MEIKLSHSFRAYDRFKFMNAIVVNAVITRDPDRRNK